MPERKTVERARADKQRGKAASTQAGNFVKEEMDHIRKGIHGAKNTKQAIAIGLSKARRAGVDLPPPSPDKASAKTRKKAERDLEVGSQRGRHASASSEASGTRSKATTRTLKKESHAAASKPALSKQARSAAAQRSPSARSAAAKKGAATKGAAGRSAASKKAASTRAERA